MEDWQEWQLRADQVAASLNSELEELEREYFEAPSDPSFRGFWPKFRALKERVRVAPAIKLEDKLDLERKLRHLGSRAYKAQESAYASSAETKTELLSAIGERRAEAENMNTARDLRALRKVLDGIRSQFEKGPMLVPADRQAVWEAWREASQFAWQKLTRLWEENESRLRELVEQARQQAEARNSAGLRQATGRFFDALKTTECRGNVANSLKTEIEDLRRTFEEAESKREAERAASQQTQFVPPVEAWRLDLERNRELSARLAEEVQQLERQVQESGSILEQAMLRGSVVEKRRKIDELARTNKSLEQRIEQAEEAPPLISVG